MNSEEAPVSLEHYTIQGELPDPQQLSVAKFTEYKDRNLKQAIPVNEQSAIIFSIDSSNPFMGGPHADLSRIERKPIKLDARTGRGTFR